MFASCPPSLALCHCHLANPCSLIDCWQIKSERNSRRVVESNLNILPTRDFSRLFASGIHGNAARRSKVNALVGSSLADLLLYRRVLWIFLIFNRFQISRYNHSHACMKKAWITGGFSRGGDVDLAELCNSSGIIRYLVRNWTLFRTAGQKGNLKILTDNYI